MEAVASGTVRHDDDTGCLVLENDQDGLLWGVAWPRGARPATKDGRRGVLVGGFLGRIGSTAILEGDRVELGGGGAQDLPGDVLAGCNYSVVWKVFGKVDVAQRGDRCARNDPR